MKKKKRRHVNLTPLRIALSIILAIVIYFAIRIYQFNNIISNTNMFETTVTENTRFFGVLNDNYYKLEDEVFSANDKNGVKFSIKVLDVKNIIYDKYIYLAEGSGRIKMLDRNTGREMKHIKFEDKIENFEKRDDHFILYSKDKVIVLNHKLEEISRRESLINPVKYDFTSKKEAFIEMDLKDSMISSIFTVKNNDNTQFSVSSTNEVFVYTRIVGDNTIVISNSYIYLINGNSIIKKILLEDISAIDYNYDKLAIVDNKNLVIYNNFLEEIERKEIGFDADLVSIRKNSIVSLNKEKLSLYENGNIIEANVSGIIDWYQNYQMFYTVFPNRIEKVNAY